MRKRDALNMIKKEIIESLPKETPSVILKNYPIVTPEKKPIFSIQFRRLAVMMILVVVLVSGFFIFGGIPGSLTPTTTTTTPFSSTSTGSITTTTPAQITTITSRDTTPVDAISLINRFQSVDYTLDISAVLEMNQSNLLLTSTPEFHPSLMNVEKLNESIITSFDDNASTTFEFDEQLSFLSNKGSEAKQMVDDAANVVVMTDTWYHTESASYYMYDDYATLDSVLIVAESNDDFYLDQKITIIYARHNLDNPELVIKHKHDYLDENRDHHLDQLYVGYLPNKRYVYYYDNLNSANSEELRDAAMWEIRRDEDCIVVTSREENLPNETIGLKRYEFYPTYATEIFTDYQSSYLKVYTNQGEFFEKTMNTTNPDSETPYILGLASLGGWSSIRFVEEQETIVESELTIGLNHYLFEDPQTPIQIHPDLVFTALNPIQNDSNDVIDVQIALKANNDISFDDVLSILVSMDLVVDLDDVDTQSMFEMISSILTRGDDVFDDLTLRGFLASGQDIILFTTYQGRFSAYMISETEKDFILAFRQESLN